MLTQNKNLLFRTPAKLGSFLTLIFVLAIFSARASQTQTNIVLQQVQTVFVIAMENHNFTQPSSVNSPQQLLGNPAAPYLNSLITPGNSNAAQVSFATKYYNCAIGTHPSEPNYIWAEAGTDFGVHTDSDPYPGNTFNAPHLTGQMNTAGIAWKNYQEDLEYAANPTTSAFGNNGPKPNSFYGTTQYFYAVKHNPMGFFTDTKNQNVYPLTNLFNDLTNNSVGRYNWITPNMFNDQHSSLSGGCTYHGVGYTGDQASIAQGDNFLATIIPMIMASPAYQSNGVIIIRWDETEGGDDANFTIPEIIISPLAKGNAYASSVVMNHSSDVKTMAEIFGLPMLQNAPPANEYAVFGGNLSSVSAVNDLSDMFQFVTAAPEAPPQPVVIITNTAPTNSLPTNSLPTNFSGQPIPNGFQLTFSGPVGQTYKVMASDDFTTPKAQWPVIGTGTFTSTNVIFPDLDAPNHRTRFYVIQTP